MREVQLTKGMIALVDDGDYERVMQHSWNPYQGTRSKTWYASSRIDYIITPMHRFIVGLPYSHPDRVDHLDEDGLNNQRYNLAIVSQSMHNLRSTKRVGARSRYKGVSWDERTQKWRADFSFMGQRWRLGRFKTEEEAALAYNEAALKHGIGNLRLNEVPQ